MTAPQQLLGPDGKTPLRRYAGYMIRLEINDRE